MNRVELPHDKARFGPLRAAIDGRPELVRLVALIRALADKEERALPAAAGIVLDRLASVDLFELNKGDDAQRVGPKQAFNFVFPHGEFISDGPSYEAPEAQLRRGPAGALAVMRKHWAESPGRDSECQKQGWDTDECSGLAILRAKAEALFPEVFGQVAPVQASAPSAQQPKQVLPPFGDTYSHPQGEPWTGVERWALFEMRHRMKYTGDELANIAGVSRQRIDELIGPAKPHGGLAKIVAKDGAWAPPAELLERVGAPLQPLQPLQAAAAKLQAA